MQKRILLGFFLSVGLTASGCNGKEGIASSGVEQEVPSQTPSQPVPESEPAVGAVIDGARIAWDYSSQVTIDDKGGCYARVVRLPDGSHMCAYETGGTVTVAGSSDGGMTWNDRKVVIGAYNHGGTVINAANAEICVLSDGTLLCGANFRPSAEGVAPWSVAVSRSEDGGKTWSERDIVYDADVYSANGCWEPYFLELPNGDVHLYFANEGPYVNSSEQEISCLISSDKGRTWSRDKKVVSFRSGFRDGMPVARIFNDQIVVAIEDNVYGNFVPFTVRCQLSDPWRVPVTGDSADREPALLEKLQLRKTYGGAPYLLKLPSGEAVMSYQRSYSDNWELSLMEVVIGDKEARNFGRPSRPFSVPNGGNCLWNSVGLLDDRTIAALGSLNDGKKTLPVLKRGVIMADMCVQDGEVKDLPVFIGAKGSGSLRAGIAMTDSDFLFKVDVKDSDLYIGRDRSDGVYIYLDAVNKGWSSCFAGVYRIWLPVSGYAVISEWKYGRWMDMDPVSAVKEETSEGYAISAVLPKSVLGDINSNRIRIGMTLCNYSYTEEGYEEDLVDMNKNEPCTWMPFTL